MSHEPAFEDVANPTEAEMRSWAYDTSSADPINQDWDIVAARRSLGSLFLRLVSDGCCPKRRFFLGCLYLPAGDAVRTAYRAQPQDHLLGLVREAEGLEEPWVRTWAQRTAMLVREPASFGYEAWCDPAGPASTPQ
ncbi:hypothetical protein [Embleya sp. AB8]|uniref:hypothetical protein n=1 Tax=Embleya sp. AB8 TaxID=3156304 RepID=UPI003C73C9E0